MWFNSLAKAFTTDTTSYAILSQAHLKLLREKLQKLYELNIQYHVDVKSE